LEAELPSELRESMGGGKKKSTDDRGSKKLGVPIIEKGNGAEF